MRHHHPTALVVIGLVLLLGTPLLWQAGRQDADFGVAPPIAAAATGQPDRATGSAPHMAPTSRARSESVTTRSARLVEAVPVAEPVRVRVASLGIDAPVRPAGVVATTGELEIPDDVRVAGWYRHGAAPGASEGSAVLSAHVDSRRQGAGVFFTLARIPEGAEIAVELTDGTTVTYLARGKRRYDKALLPTAELFARDGGHRLVLITCGGPFDDATRRYRDNVVVIAEPATGP